MNSKAAAPAQSDVTSDDPDVRRFEADMRAAVASSELSFTVYSWAIRVGVLVVFAAVWQFVVGVGLIDRFFISSPVEVTKGLAQFLGKAASWQSTWQTFKAALLGLSIGSAMGVLTGIVFSRYRVIRRAMNPYLTLFNSMPRPALAPIFILWFGLGASPKVLVAISLVFFILLLNTMAGLERTDPDIVMLSKSLGMSASQSFRLMQVPAALPSIMAGLRLGAVYSVLGVVVSEMVASYDGLGQLLVQESTSFNITTSFDIIIVMAMMAMTLDALISVLQRRLSWDSPRG